MFEVILGHLELTNNGTANKQGIKHIIDMNINQIQKLAWMIVQGHCNIFLWALFRIISLLALSSKDVPCNFQSQLSSRKF